MVQTSKTTVGAESLAKETEASANRLSILIADTSPYILDYLTGVFQLSNYDVRRAETAKECIDTFKGILDKVDLVLLDGTIANDEGVGVILAIRRLKPEQKILVIVDEENARSQAMSVGADVAVVKPMTAEGILNKATELLAEKESFLERKRKKYKRR